MDEDIKLSFIQPILATAWDGTSAYQQIGTSGVAVMQMSVIDDQYVIFFDKAEHNPLTTSDGNHAWSALFNTYAHTVRALKLVTNSFCAGGGWLGNGTLIDYGGNPQESVTSGNGVMGIRLYTPQPNGTGEIWEDPATIHLTTNRRVRNLLSCKTLNFPSYRRWYPSSARISDGSQIIFGGALAGGFNDIPSFDNPTLEFFPPKGNGQPITSQFLKDAMPSNLFPHMFTLPDNRIFVAANTLAMIYNWVDNTETRLPNFPNGVRVNYPWSAGAVLLPLTSENNYTPEVLFCGGSTVDDSLSPSDISSQTPASNQCARMVLDTVGISAGWQVETMPGTRLMNDAIVMPDGNILFINGVATGVAGYGNVADQIGQSNADNPVLTPWLYTPSAAEGQRFTTGFANTTIGRLYHSTASLLPDGSVLVAGSNPNADVSTTKYMTQYEVETFQPPYMSMIRPSYAGTPQNIDYGQIFTVTVSNPGNATAITAAIMDLGFHTHAVSLDSKYVGLVSNYDSTSDELNITGPPNAYIYPPGPAWLYILGDGIPSNGTKVMIGTGADPPSSAEAYKGAIKYSKEAQAQYQNMNLTSSGGG
ncbi:glyoxal oxidase [Piloderma croceum F 1598]|uniref:Glyoxal oxidase n=1 Tax=Piloderma croceum (strain F 1598) TaxID=765440 RepID=A0A0C3EU49_PILCF|nr:glyoxal oxidase [Piloderma croceum F 1598]